MRISDWSSDVCSSDLLPWRLQALQHDLELLVLGPASPPARLHHFQPLDLGTALITVHKDSSQHHASPWQGGSRRRDTLEALLRAQIGRASCRERVCQYV